MRWLIVLLCGSLLAGTVAEAADGRVLKVLPQFMDKDGHTSVSPSLYDRDAYQSFLRRHPAEQSGVRFAVQWKAKSTASQNLKLRLELRGVAQADTPREMKLELPVQQHHWFSHWANVDLNGETFRKFGEVTAWRVTLWDGDQLLSEQKSFLWQ